jgi:hypothetical protein
MKKLAFLFMSSLILLASCGKRSDNNFLENFESKETTAAAMDLSPPPPPADGMVVGTSAPPSETQKEDKSEEYNKNTTGLTQSSLKDTPIKIAEKIKKTANIDISVDDYKLARAAIEKIIKAGNAYIGGENEQNSTYSITNSMTIRVSNKDFDVLVGNLSSVASHVNSKNIYMEDVTAQFVDITARLKTKKEVEKRYLDLLQKAVKVSDIIEVEEQLRVIREEIEAKEGELKYLNDQVDYSTIILSLHQNFEYAPEEEPGFFGRMGHAFGNGWNGFLSFLIGIVYTWPVWLILGLIAYFLVRFIKRKLKKSKFDSALLPSS